MLRFQANVLLIDGAALLFDGAALLFDVLFNTVEELLFLYRSTVLLATAFFTLVLCAVGLEILFFLCFELSVPSSC